MKMDCCHHAEARKAQTGQRGRGFSYMFFERKERGDLSEGIGRGERGEGWCESGCAVRFLLLL